MNHLFKFVFTFVLLAYASICMQAQDKYLDSLQNRLETVTSDTAKVNLMNRISKRLMTSNPTLSLAKAKEAIVLAQKNDYKQGEIVAYQISGVVYRHLLKVDSAEKYTKIALDMSQKYHYKKEESVCLVAIGDIYCLQSRKQEGLTAYLKGLTIAESQKNTRVILPALINIGVLHLGNNNFKKAEEYFRKAIKIAEGTEHKEHCQSAYTNLGVIYQAEGDYENAILNFEKARTFTSQMANKNSEAFICRNLGGIKFQQEKYAESRNYLMQCLEAAKETHNIEIQTSALACISACELRLKRYDVALKYGLEAEEILADNYNEKAKSETYQVLFEIYQAMNNYKKALDYHILYKTVEDSMFNADKSAQIDEMQTKYEVEKKEVENSLLKKEKDLKDARIKQQFWIIISSLIITSLVIFLSLILYRGRQKEKQANAILAEQKMELQHKNKLLEELNAVKDKLFSIISHDLRSPLASLKSLLGLLNDNSLSPEQANAIFPKITQDVNYTSDLLDSLLRWAKNQLHGIHVTPKKLNIKEIAEENFNLLHTIAEQKNIYLMSNISENIFITADKDMTHTIFRNLISNALKFTKIGGKIAIYAHTKEKEIEITVADTGVGMSQQVISQLFKGNLTTRGTKNEKGTGLGLMLVKDFVEKNNGTIRVESEVNVGSRFIFTLPLAEAFEAGV